MKRLILILLLTLPLAVAAQSSLYKQYEKRPDMAVGQVTGFRLNDKEKVDVVILVADNDRAWAQLKKELDIRTSEGVTSWLAEPDHPAKRTRWDGKPVCKIIASHSRRTVAFYLIETEAQYEALLDYQMDHMHE